MARRLCERDLRRAVADAAAVRRCSPARFRCWWRCECDSRLAFGIAAVGAVAAGGVVFSSADPACAWIVGRDRGAVRQPGPVSPLLLQAHGSLNLCFQIAVLGAALR